MSVLDKHLVNATFKPEPEAEATAPLSTTLDTAAKKDNLRRLKFPVFVTEHADGTRSFVHDPGVIRDGLISSTAADRGKGERSSDALSKEQRTAREPSDKPSRDSSGKFVSKGNGDAA